MGHPYSVERASGLAYHLGTVWPFANATIGYVFKRYGFDLILRRLASRHPHPGIYPGACAPQAWSASAITMLLQAPEVTLEGVSIGTARADLRFWRDDTGFTNHQVLHTIGTLDVRRHKPHTGAGVEDRLVAAIREAIG